jgi:DNA-binding IclR family transcriptional regulator
MQDKGSDALRDQAREQEERQRFRVLERAYALTDGDCGRVLLGRELADRLGLSLESIFRHLEYLASRRYLRYIGAGPRVCLDPRGVKYVEAEAGRRRSIREDRPFSSRRAYRSL